MGGGGGALKSMKGGPKPLKIWTPGDPHKLGGFGQGVTFLLAGVPSLL